MLHVESLVIGYRHAVVARDLTFELAAGEFACLLGPNGAGKSTLLRTLLGMQPALGGQICVDQVPLSGLAARQRARRIAAVLTERVATGLLTARELVALGRQPHTDWNGQLRAEDHAAVERALADVGSLNYSARLVSDLSDGERQRIWLARALAQDPRLLVLDEVLAFLDLPRRVQVMHLLRRIARERGIGIVLSCHDIELAMRDADTLWLLEPGGRFHVGAPDTLATAGTLEAVFAREGVRFDQGSGRFYVAEEVR